MCYYKIAYLLKKNVLISRLYLQSYLKLLFEKFAENQSNMFKESFKYYKSKDPMPSFEDVLDFHNNVPSLNGKVKQLHINTNNVTAQFDLIEPSKWEVYEITEKSGFIYIKNPFTSHGQRYWIQQSLEEFTKKPNKLNIDIHSLVPVGLNWWQYAQNKESVFKKLRWSTLGYHHNWDTKFYSEELKDTFPDNLSKLCDHFSRILGFDFKAEAAIVNFYHIGSTLSGHTDHSEEFLDAPLLSFSFGNSAIFLLGGLTIEEKPTAVFLYSGDVVIMSRESRLSYHAIPRIVKADKKPWTEVCHTDLTDEFSMYFDLNCFKSFNAYLEDSRINLNVRQVLKYGQVKLTM